MFVDHLAGKVTTPTLLDSLNDVRTFIHRFVHLSHNEATLLTMWTALTHALEAFDYVPYIHVTSPLPECGKSRLLEILEPLVANPWMTSRVTAAVLMRKVEKDHPTLLLDESDAMFNGGDEQYSEALRGMLNAGFHRSGRCSVCVGQGANLAFKDFSVFGPKCIAGIGRLPSTVESRSIPVALKRRLKGERLHKWRRRDGWEEAAVIRERVVAAMTGKLEALRRSRPAMPEGLSDRAEDVLEPLFAIADLAGGEWPEPVRDAAVSLMGQAARNARETDLTRSLELLTDIHRVFEAHPDQDALHAKTIVEKLVAQEDRPWATLGKNEKPMTAHKVAHLLKPFEILPAGQLWIDGKNLNGYRRDAFTDAFARYIGIQTLDSRNYDNPNSDKPLSPRVSIFTRDPLESQKPAIHPDKHCDSRGLEFQNQEHKERRSNGLSPDELKDRGDALFKRGWH